MLVLSPVTPVPPTLQWALAPLLLTLTLGTASAPTTITPPANAYSPAEDVELGRDAAAEVHKQVSILVGGPVDAYIKDVGRRLVEAIPTTLRQPAFVYSFDVVNFNEIASFALPGGPMFFSRGMIETARSDGELAGVMAHQLSHIVLRHGTAQATAGERFQVGAIAGQAIGAIIAGTGDGIITEGSNFGVRTYFLMYSQEYERQADVLAEQLLASAGYDPQDVTRALHAAQNEGGGRGGPQWMKSHPDPGTRSKEIRREAFPDPAVADPAADELESMQARLRQMPVGHRLQQPGRSADGPLPVGTGGYRTGVVVPSGEYGSVTAGDLLLMRVPANWRRLPASNTVTFAPEGAFVNTLRGAMGVTHGVQVGVARGLTGNLQGDMEALLEALARGNRHVRWTPAYQRTTIAGRSGLTTVLSNVSSLNGEFEHVSVSAAHLPDGSLLYVIGVAPQEEAGTYRNAFNQMRESLQIVN